MRTQNKVNMIEKSSVVLEPMYMCITASSDSKESACNAEDLGSITTSGKSPEKSNGYPFLYSCLGKFHRQRSLAG